MDMTDRRYEFHEKLCDILGSRNVYYMPGSDITMHYPCIRYEMSAISSKYANNMNYTNRPQYTVTLITDDPDTELRQSLMEFLRVYPFRYDRHYMADNLCHDVFVVNI